MADGNGILYSTNNHGLVLCPSCVPEKVDINQEGVVKNYLYIIFTYLICSDRYRGIIQSDNCHL
jgi:hypothetical protein